MFTLVRIAETAIEHCNSIVKVGEFGGSRHIKPGAGNYE
jgi:hypothetical protein